MADTKQLTDGPVDFHILRLEVTVAAALVDPVGHVVGGNVVDTTLAFGWRTDAPPPGVPDAMVNDVLSKQTGPVLALITSSMVFNGWVAMGMVDAPMTEHSSPTGEVGRTGPVTVQVRFPDEGQAVHD
jgi:hypothetical protein